MKQCLPQSNLYKKNHFRSRSFFNFFKSHFYLLYPWNWKQHDTKCKVIRSQVLLKTCRYGWKGFSNHKPDSDKILRSSSILSLGSKILSFYEQITANFNTTYPRTSFTITTRLKFIPQALIGYSGVKFRNSILLLRAFADRALIDYSCVTAFDSFRSFTWLGYVFTKQGMPWLPVVHTDASLSSKRAKNKSNRIKV